MSKLEQLLAQRAAMDEAIAAENINADWVFKGTWQPSKINFNASNALAIVYATNTVQHNNSISKAIF